MKVPLYAVAPLFVALAACVPHPADPLGQAASQGNLQQLRRLLAGASIADRNSALVWAARFGQPQAIVLLVGSGADPNSTSGVNDWSVLMQAIHKNQPGAVEALLNAGAEPNRRGRNGETPLMMAAGYGYTDIVRILVDRGADARAKLPDGENALDLAAQGTTDIDHFTFGHCQSETVRLLRGRFPNLRAENPSKLKSCS